MGKAEATKQFILEQVSSIFNRKGYIGTSMSDITSATKLTKGAIYGNFENKDDLAIQAFKYNVRQIIFPLSDQINAIEDPHQQLYLITNYYRAYFKKTGKMGGCPIINVATDSKNIHPKLYKAVKQIVEKLVGNIEQIIISGQEKGLFNPSVDAKKTAKQIYSMIEGGIFTASTINDDSYLENILEHIEEQIYQNLKI